MSITKTRGKIAERGKNSFAAEITIPNKKGLHARASAQFVRCAGAFKANIRVSREGQTVGGTSIMGLMMLASGQGHAIQIDVDGEEAKPAIEALVALVENGFGEDD